MRPPSALARLWQALLGLTAVAVVGAVLAPLLPWLVTALVCLAGFVLLRNRRY